MKAIAYCRASTMSQCDHDGCSLEVQESKIRAYCLLRDIDLMEVVVDPGVSGGKPISEREGGKKILEAIQKGRVQAVVTLKLDRLFRDAADCLVTTKEWDKKNIGLHVIDMGGQSLDTRSAMSRMFLTMAAGFAELERMLIGERTRTALRHKISKGERAGQIPYGFSLARDDKSLIENPREQEVIRLIKELHAAGHNYSAICRELTGRGIDPLGKQWHAQSVKNILRRTV